MTLAILVPVLGRPHRVRPIVDSALKATPAATVVFVCNQGDAAELRACQETVEATTVVVPWRAGPGDYAKKINHGFRAMAPDHDWVFLGADDLVFHPGWWEACLAAHERTGACVVGTNDLGNKRTDGNGHSTHSLVSAAYLECGTADREGAILHEGYDHQYVDDELVMTARSRGTYVHEAGAVVEHLHPDWGKATRDATYRKAQRATAADRTLYRSREWMWR